MRAADRLVRATSDIDLWVRPTAANAERVLEARLAFGALADQFSAAPFTQRDQVLQIGVAPLRIGILTSVSGLEFGDAWARKEVVDLGGLTVSVLCQQDLAANKRATDRPQDIVDLRWIDESQRRGASGQKLCSAAPPTDSCSRQDPLSCQLLRAHYRAREFTKLSIWPPKGPRSWAQRCLASQTCEDEQVSHQHIEITPSVTVHTLLEVYPELEEVLIGIAPPFKKLRNPFLRKSVAKVATLKHVSSVGGVPLDELIDRLREAVGQPNRMDSYEDQDYCGEQPGWFSPARISLSLDEDEVEDKDRMTLVVILEEASNVKRGEIIELTTSFLPAPGIDILKSKGYSVWTRKEEDHLFKSYILKNMD